MGIEDAIQQFREAAISKGTFAEPAARDHAFHKAMSVAWRQLHASGPVGQDAFKALLSDDSRHVRAWAAAQLLALGDESGLPVPSSCGPPDRAIQRPALRATADVGADGQQCEVHQK